MEEVDGEFQDFLEELLSKFLNMCYKALPTNNTRFTFAMKLNFKVHLMMIMFFVY